jgi:nucleoside 2-deoxyribosyltransferase
VKVYIAGPISGLSYEQVNKHLEETSRMLRGYGYDVLSPMSAKEHLRTELEFKSHGYTGNPISTNHAIFERDQFMVLNADIVFADLTHGHDRVSIGTMYELAWASLMHKHTVVVMNETNIHQHAFVLEAADIVFEDWQEAMKYLKTFAECD